MLDFTFCSKSATLAKVPKSKNMSGHVRVSHISFTVMLEMQNQTPFSSQILSLCKKPRSLLALAVTVLFKALGTMADVKWLQ